MVNSPGNPTAPKDALGMTEIMDLLMEDRQTRESELLEQKLWILVVETWTRREAARLRVVEQT